MQELYLQIILSGIAFGIGLTLNLKGLVRTASKFRYVALGLVLQLLVMPLIAIAAASIFSLEREAFIGVLIVALCPGGVTSNLMTYMMGGNSALSVLLTSLNSIITLLTIPIGLVVIIQVFEVIDPGNQWAVLLEIGYISFLTVLLPTAIGLLSRNYLPNASRLVERYLKYILPAALGVFYLYALLGGTAEHAGPAWRHIPFNTLFALLFLNFSSFVAASLLAWLMGLRKRAAMTLAIETSLQNTTFAILIIMVVFGFPGSVLSAILYANISFASTLAMALVLRTLYGRNSVTPSQELP